MNRELGDVEDYLGEFVIDKKEVRRYEDRTQYGEKSIDIMVLSCVPMLFIIPVVIGNMWLRILDQGMVGVMAITGISILGAGLIVGMTISGLSSLLRRTSNVNEGLVLVFELRSAVDEYQRGNYEGVLECMENVNYRPKLGSSRFISGYTKRNLRYYRDRLKESDDLESDVRDTFPRIARIVTEELKSEDEDKFSDVFDSISSHETKIESRPLYRLLKDVWNLVKYFSIGNIIGVAVGAIIIGVFITTQLGFEAVGTVVPTVILTIYIYLQQSS